MEPLRTLRVSGALKEDRPLELWSRGWAEQDKELGHLTQLPLTSCLVWCLFYFLLDETGRELDWSAGITTPLDVFLEECFCRTECLI